MNIKRIGDGAMAEFTDAISAVDHLLERADALERGILSGQLDAAAVPN